MVLFSRVFVSIVKIGEESDEVGRTCRTNERGSTTKDGIMFTRRGEREREEDHV